MCKNMAKQKQEELNKKTRCEVTTVKYLGINLMMKNIDLYKKNYENLWAAIKQDLEKWKTLNLSILGKIALIKMNVLPRIMFVFQAIPII